MRHVLTFALASLALPAFAQTVPDPMTPANLPDTIVVTASNVEQPRDEVGQAITVLDTMTIRERQTAVVSDILRTMAGVTVTRTGGIGSVTGVSIRGAETAQTLVLIDGVRVNDPSSPAGGFDFGLLMTGNVSRIEVLRGPNSVIWEVRRSAVSSTCRRLRRATRSR